MTAIKTRIRVSRNGRITGHVPGLPVGEHEAEITLVDAPTGRSDADELLARVRAIQAEVARLPILDRRDSEQILDYNERGHFD